MKLIQSLQIFLGALALGDVALAQAPYEPSPLHLRIEGEDIVFEADVCLDMDAGGPTTRVGIPRMKVEMVYTRWVVDHFDDYDLLQVTDAAGRIRIPAGSDPLYGDVYGPQSSDCVVFQEASISGVLVEVEPVASLDFRSGPVVLNVPSFGGPFAEYAPLFIRESHLNAYVHAQRAFDALRLLVGTPPSGPVNIRFQRAMDSEDEDQYRDFADYTPFRVNNVVVERVLRIWGAAIPDDARIAWSGTGVAHEVAHHFLEPFGFLSPHSPFCLAPSDQFNEGLPDYLACVVTGHTEIGRGVHPELTPRVIANNPTPRYADIQDCAIPGAHRRGLVISGCLLDSRIRFAARVPDGGAVFDGMARYALDALRGIVPTIIDMQDMPDEVSVLRYLIEINPDSTSLRILYEAFSLGGGVPWPYFWVPTGVGVVIPELGARSTANRLDVSIAHATPGVPLVVLGSLDPSQAWVLGPASLYLDPLSMRVLGVPVASAQGSATLSLPLPAGASGLDIALTAVVMPATGSPAVSNGVRLRL